MYIYVSCGAVYEYGPSIGWVSLCCAARCTARALLPRAIVVRLSLSKIERMFYRWHSHKYRVKLTELDCVDYPKLF